MPIVKEWWNRGTPPADLQGKSICRGRQYKLNICPEVSYRKNNFMNDQELRSKFIILYNLGKEYSYKYLTGEYLSKEVKVNINDLETDWKSGLKYFIFHALMRGRSDETSTQYYRNAIKVIDKYKLEDLKREYVNENLSFNVIKQFKKENIMAGNRNAVTHPDFKDYFKSHRAITDLVACGLNNDKDIMMILDTLKFIIEKEENIWLYIKKQILSNNGMLGRIHAEIDEISYIGDKLACFIILDSILLDGNIRKILNMKKDNLLDAFPVDTWIRQVAIKLGCTVDPKIEDNKADRKVKIYFIEKCEKYGISSFEVAQGAWYLGFAAFDILLDPRLKICF